MDLQRDSQAQRPDKTAKPPHGGFFYVLTLDGTAALRSQRTLCSVSSPALCQKQAFLLRNHYVLITGGQVVFYEVYAFSECQLNANVMTGKRVTDVAVNHQRWRVICRRSVYCSKPDRISRADGATNVGRYVRKCTSYWSMDMACRNGE